MNASQVKQCIGQSLKQQRKKLRSKQSDIAALAGVSLRTLIAIEQGTANPSIETLAKIAGVVGLELTLAMQ